MSRICDICEKGYLKGNLVPRGIGNRVTNRAIKKQKPNLRRKKITIQGTTVTANICASCLKRLKMEAHREEEHVAAENQ